MKDLIVLLMHLMATLAKLMGPGGAKAVVTDSPIMKQQLLVTNRSRQRAPNLSVLDRFLLGFWSLFLSPLHRGNKVNTYEVFSRDRRYYLMPALDM